LTRIAIDPVRPVGRLDRKVFGLIDAAATASAGPMLTLTASR